MEVKFKVKGINRTNKYYMRSIPERYAGLFDGYNFKSSDHFKLAAMYADLANNANRYNTKNLEAYELQLVKILNKDNQYVMPDFKIRVLSGFIINNEFRQTYPDVEEFYDAEDAEDHVRWLKRAGFDAVIEKVSLK